jgi:Flp pilus assembly protein TadG
MMRAAHGSAEARGRNGWAILEFAIGSGVLLAAFTGAFRFGYSFLQYNRLTNAVIQGARYASIIPYDSTNATPSSAFLSSVRNMVLYGNPDGGTSTVIPGLTSANVNVTVTFTNSVPAAITVSISGYTIDSVFGSQTLTNKPKFTYPYLGIWSPI